MLEIGRNDKLLFIGDSITDCGRRNDPEGMGSGYVRMIRDWLLASQPADAPIVLNKGIGGHKVTDLEARWQTDVLDEKPDILSIKIGVNDVWHAYAATPSGVTPGRYASVFQSILKQVRENLPNCRIVLCEPSIIWPPAPEGANEAMKPYLQSVHVLAQEFNAVCVVPLHKAFT
ncbi:MAG TPA: SGNH/GDSL hydrolase family protein, partial [bacterium]|nr:SGNH/GDSL hydrolase family protein [bacterium]